MVFEQLFQFQWIKRRPLFMLLLGFTYAIIGIGSALMIFGKNPSLMSVAFISILLIPTLNSLLQSEESEPLRKNRFNIFGLFKDHFDIFKIYFFLFIGIFLAYYLYTAFLPQAASQHIFSAQLDIAGLAGNAYLSSQFSRILINNLIVLVACFLLSLVYGAGAILFLTWNASAWGAIFGFVANQSSNNPLMAFWGVIIPILPHMITEAASYLSAAICGGVVSKAVVKEKPGSPRFNKILTDGIFLLLMSIVLIILAGYLEVYVFPLFQ